MNDLQLSIKLTPWTATYLNQNFSEHVMYCDDLTPFKEFQKKQVNNNFKESQKEHRK